MKKIIITFLMIAAIPAAFAVPTIFGPTGGLMVADAFVAEESTISIHQSVNDSLDFPIVAVTVPYKEFEVAGSVLKYRGDSTDWHISGKAASPITLFYTDLAVGVAVGNSHFSGSFMATREFDEETSASLNLSYIRESGRKGTALSFGAEKVVANNITAGAELFFANKLGHKTSGNIYGRAKLGESFGVTLGFTNLSR